MASLLEAAQVIGTLCRCRPIFLSGNMLAVPMLMALSGQIEELQPLSGDRKRALLR